MNVSVKINGLNKLQRFAEKFPQIAEKYTNIAINRSLLRVLGAEKQEAPYGVSGQLRDNWKVVLGRFEGALVSLSSYARYVEFGTKPHMPPVEPLIPWAKKKGLNPWAVARSIAKKGTKANPFLQRALDNTKTGVESEFRDALAQGMEEVNSFPDV